MDGEAKAVRRALGEADAATWVAVEYVGTYLALKSQIAGLEARADEARAAIAEALHVDGAEPGRAWKFEGLGTVTIVKGRVSEKLDRAKLARAGVAAEVLDAATVRIEGKPSMRVTVWEEDSDAA